jgi:hypothetical protein
MRLIIKVGVALFIVMMVMLRLMHFERNALDALVND